MPNVPVRLGDPPTPFRAVDNGDGTFSLATSGGGGGVSATLYDGTINAAASAAALIGSSQPCVECVVQNDPSSATDCYVGNATSQSMRLRPGDSELFPVADVNKIYVKAVSGTPRMNWHARS